MNTRCSTLLLLFVSLWFVLAASSVQAVAVAPVKAALRVNATRDTVLHFPAAQSTYTLIQPAGITDVPPVPQEPEPQEPEPQEPEPQEREPVEEGGILEYAGESESDPAEPKQAQRLLIPMISR